MELDHTTAVTPTLSLAAPLITMEVSDVVIVAEAGEAIVRDGGVVSFPPGAAGGGAGAGGFAGGLDAAGGDDGLAAGGFACFA